MQLFFLKNKIKLDAAHLVRISLLSIKGLQTVQNSQEN